MKKERFKKLITQQMETLQALTASKGEEYTRSDDDQLANFKRQAAELGLVPEKILAVYLNKHLDSIKTYIKHKTPNSIYALAEPIEGRIDDAILYLLLLKAMVIEEKGGGVGRDCTAYEHKSTDHGTGTTMVNLR